MPYLGLTNHLILVEFEATEWSSRVMNLYADIADLVRETDARLKNLALEESCAEDDYLIECRAKIDALTEMRDRLNALLQSSPKASVNA